MELLTPTPDPSNSPSNPSNPQVPNRPSTQARMIDLVNSPIPHHADLSQSLAAEELGEGSENSETDNPSGHQLNLHRYNRTQIHSPIPHPPSIYSPIPPPPPHSYDIERLRPHSTPSSVYSHHGPQLSSGQSHLNHPSHHPGHVTQGPVSGIGVRSSQSLGVSARGAGSERVSGGRARSQLAYTRRGGRNSQPHRSHRHYTNTARDGKNTRMFAVGLSSASARSFNTHNTHSQVGQHESAQRTTRLGQRGRRGRRTRKSNGSGGPSSGLNQPNESSTVAWEKVR